MGEARGDETRRRYVDCSGVGDGGVPGTGCRDCSLLGTKPALVERDNCPPDMTLARGDEVLDARRDKGDVGRTPPELLVDSEGDAGRFTEGGDETTRAVDVAWCLSDGGADAIAFAFARLAAMAAATLLFLTWGVCTAVGRLFSTVGSGHAFSSCFRAVASNSTLR